MGVSRRTGQDGTDELYRTADNRNVAFLWHRFGSGGKHPFLRNGTDRSRCFSISDRFLRHWVTVFSIWSFGVDLAYAYLWQTTAY